MITIRGRNVNEIYAKARALLPQVGTWQASRAGRVLAAPCPVMSVYQRSAERVLWNSGRDANPMFHLCESLWMLAGRDDSAFLDEFVSDFGSRFAEPSGRLHGAYGARWRTHYDGDQLTAIVERMRRDPLDRRCVVSMWDPTMDLVNPLDCEEDGQYAYEPRDIPCNTHIYPRIRERLVEDSARHGSHVLDLTVCCRSNDLIWGAYGANAVHFSVLQEYLAAALKCGVGTLYQFSNNWHAYESARARYPAPVSGSFNPDFYLEPNEVCSVPMVTNPDTFLAECVAWCEAPTEPRSYENKFLSATATPMAVVNQLRKTNKQAALVMCQNIEAPDWRLACCRWLERRLEPAHREERDGRDC